MTSLFDTSPLIFAKLARAVVSFICRTKGSSKSALNLAERFRKSNLIANPKIFSKPSLIWKMINEIGHAQISENLAEKQLQARIRFK